MAHLSEAQRYTISQLKKQNFSLSQIGEIIGKDKSVICSELARNCDGRNGEYRCDLVQRKYEKRMSSKPKSRRFTDEIRSYVTEKLKDDLSPEQIVGRCRLLGMPCVSHESIYKYVWDDKKRGGELSRHLRRKGRKYRKRGTQYNSRGLIRASPNESTWTSISPIRTTPGNGEPTKTRTDSYDNTYPKEARLKI